MENNHILMEIKNRIDNHQFKNKEELQLLINNLKNGRLIKNEEEEVLLELYEKSIAINEVPKLGNDVNYQNILLDLEKKINNNEFTSKEELVNYINKLKSNGMPDNILTPEKITEYLNTYDTLNPVLEPSLNLENYKGVNLEDNNVIVGIKQEAILKTDRTNEEMPQEFRENQNELTALGEDSLANADEVFKHMQEHKKEELTLIPIDEAINKDNVDVEILNKIKYFITNEYIDPYAYRVDIENAYFYNIETNEVLEVRKNEETGEYEIYKGGEKAYGDSQPEENNEENELEEDKNEEQMAYQNKNVKVRRLIKPPEKSSAFVQSSLLFIICIALSLVASLVIILNK